MLPRSDITKPDCSVEKAIIEQVMQGEPPYKKCKFELSSYSNLIYITELAISTYCEQCDAQRVFKTAVNEKVRNVFAKDVVTLCAPVPAGTKPANPQEHFANASYCVNIEMNCAMCGASHYYTILFKGDSIIKIGQYPSYTTTEVQNVRKYKNLISKYYPELTRSVNAYSQRMGVAAFVYLRRILEHLIEKRFTGDKTWKFEEKLREVEKTEQIIPEELEPIKVQIYSVLSKGIHEYEEDECLGIYLSVKYVIERMLDIELAKQENEVKAKDAMAAIQQQLKKKE